MNFSTIPPYASIRSRATVVVALSASRTSSGSASSDEAVNPSRSTNRIETSFRSSRGADASASGAPHREQKSASGATPSTAALAGELAAKRLLVHPQEYSGETRRSPRDRHLVTIGHKATLASIPPS